LFPFIKSSKVSSNFYELVIGHFHVLFKIFTRFLHGIIAGAVTPLDGDAFTFRCSFFQNFKKIKKEFPNCKYSLAASGGIFLGKEYHYDMVRPGISLYGGKRTFHKGIKHAVSLKVPVTQINQIKKGESIGYSRTFYTKKNTTTATIPIGYADGLNIRLSNKGFFLFKGKKVSIIGRVSMDLIILDVTKFKNKIKVGDMIDIYNSDYTIDDFAKQTGTIPYRIITCMSQRYDKKYI